MRITASDRSAAHVRRRVTDHMTAQTRIFRPTDPVFDPITGMMSSGAGALVYEGKARIHHKTNSTIVVGEADLATTVTTVSIPADAAQVHKDDVIVVDANPRAPFMVGQAMRVMGNSGGGMIGAVQTLQAVGLADSGQWQRA